MYHRCTKVNLLISVATWYDSTRIPVPDSILESDTHIGRVADINSHHKDRRQVRLHFFLWMSTVIRFCRAKRSLKAMNGAQNCESVYIDRRINLIIRWNVSNFRQIARGDSTFIFESDCFSGYLENSEGLIDGGSNQLECQVEALLSSPRPFIKYS